MNRFFLLLLLSTVLGACPGVLPRGADDDDSAGDDDDDDDDTAAADDDDTTPAPETDCDDGQDNDDDSLVDCDDPDCADFTPCTWPEAIEHSGDFQFLGDDIQCEFLGFPVDYSVDDCTTTYAAALGQDVSVSPCPSCDRTFEGPFNYSEDSCAELLDQASPTSGAFGLVFLGPTEWEFHVVNEETGLWEAAGIATDDGTGTHVFVASEPIVGQPEDCGWPTEQTLGQLTATLSFTPTAAP